MKKLLAVSLLIATTVLGSQPLKAQPYRSQDAKPTEFAALLPYCETPGGTFQLGWGYWPVGSGCWVAPNGPYGPTFYGTVVYW